MSQKLDNRPGGVYDEAGNVPDDDALRKITGIGHDDEADIDRRADEDQDGESDNGGLSGEQLGAAESAGGAASKKAPAADSLEKDKLYTPGDDSKVSLRDRLQGSRKARGFLFGGAAAGSIIGIVIMILGFLAPFKVTAIINSIEDRVGKVPQNAVDHRLEFYMSQFLILQAAKNAGVDWEKDRNYIYISKTGVFSTLYTNWRGAKLDAKLQTEFNMKITPNKPKGELLGRKLMQPTNWDVEITNADGTVTKRNMNAKESRQMIRTFAKDSTKSHQVFKRYTTRKVLKRYHGIHNWKPFENRRDNARASWYEKKAGYKKFMVRQTIGRMAPLRAVYINCLIDGNSKDSCKSRQLNPPDRPPVLDPDTEAAFDENNPENNGASTDENGQEGVGRVVQKTVLKRVLAGSLAGVGVLQLANSIQGAVEDGAGSKVVYNNLSGQYAGFGAAVESAADQVRSGDVGSDEARILAEQFDGFDGSPVYQASLKKSGTVSAAGETVSRDCDGDGKYEQLEPGETVCPNRKVMQDREGIKRTPFWPVINTLGNAYDKSGLGAIFNAINSGISFVLEKTGAEAGLTYVMEKTGIAKGAASVVEKALAWFVGFDLTGDEEGPDAYDATYASKHVQHSTVGSTLDVSAREDTVGGQYLSNEQVQAIRDEEYNDKRYALGRMGIFERYFSPDNQDSITTYAVMHTPTNLSNFAASLFSIPSYTLKTISSATFSSIHAAPKATVNNPFGVLNFGYANDHPALSMNETDLRTLYQCDLPPEQRSQNQDNSANMGRPDGVPFDIPISVDPCTLEKSVEKAGSGLFAGGFNDLNQ